MSQSVKTPARIPKKDRQAETSKEASAAVALDEPLTLERPGLNAARSLVPTRREPDPGVAGLRVADATHRVAAVDGDGLGGYVGRRVAHEEEDRGRNLLGPTDPAQHRPFADRRRIDPGDLPGRLRSLRGDPTDGDTVCPDAVRAPLRRRHLGEHLERCLRGRVVGAALDAVHAGVGRDVDDRPRALFEEVSSRLTRGDVGGSDVEVEAGVPRLCREAAQRPKPGAARVVDEDVEPTELIDAALD